MAASAFDAETIKRMVPAQRAGVGDADDLDMDAFGRRRRGGFRLQAEHGPGFVEDVDGAVGQPRVAQVPRRELGGAVEGAVGVQHVVVLLVA